MQKKNQSFPVITPRIKKSIQKNKDKWLIDKEKLKIAPHKFIQPIKFYILFSDLIILDNPFSFGDNDEYISEIQLFYKYKYVNEIKIEDNNIHVIFNEEKTEQHPIELLIERLDSLGIKEAKDLSISLINFSILMQKFKQRSATMISPENFPFQKDSENKYSDFDLRNKNIFNENSEKNLVKLKFSFNKNNLRDFLFGPHIKEIIFNETAIKTMLNKKANEVGLEEINDLFYILAIPKFEYFTFIKQSIENFFTPKNESNYGIFTSDKIYLKCKEKFQRFSFKSQTYDEESMFIFKEIDKNSQLQMNYIRAQNEAEFENNKKLEDASKLYKERYIKNFDMIKTDSWKILSLLYYGNNNNNNNQESQEIVDKDLANQKICGYRKIDDVKTIKFN